MNDAEGRSFRWKIGDRFGGGWGWRGWRGGGGGCQTRVVVRVQDSCVKK